MMRFEEWIEKYKPISKPNGLEGDYEFETFGKDFEFVKNQEPNRVWTEVDTDGYTLLYSGLLFTNRVLYYVTTVPWEGEICIILEEPDEDNEPINF